MQSPPGTLQPLELSLALDIDEQPIGGTLRQAAGSPQPFGGWLELIAAIEAALQRARMTTTDQAPG
jgi:hypothetical protein